MNKQLLTLLGILVLFVAGCTSGNYGSQSAQGRAVFTITDAAADMGSVTNVNVVVDSVQVHSETKGWITVSQTQKTYDLLALKAQSSQALLADATLENGTYDQMRLDISSVTVVDSSGSHDAKLPSNELKVVGQFDVKANTVSTATFDFVVDHSLHVTGNGEYILAPVVKLDTQEDADVDVSDETNIHIKSGKAKTHVEVGMDVSGNVGVGVDLKDEALSVEDGKVKLGNKVNVGIDANI